MKVLLIIDNLNSGGSQRQIVNLAIGLKKHNFNPVLITYTRGEHFQSALKEHGVEHISLYTESFLKTALRVVREIVRQKPDVICAYLFKPSLLGFISKMIYPFPVLFVSERAFEYPGSDWSRTASRWLYPLAKKIIVNSHSQLALLHKKLPWVRRKLMYIGNSVDLEKFFPAERNGVRENVFTVISVGHVNELKNTKVLIRAAASLYHDRKVPIRVKWVGRNYDVYGQVNKYYEECIDLIKALNIESIWSWEGKQSDMPSLYNSADVLVHASFGEGFPNTISEALACGCPVIASRVYDHPKIVTEGVHGFLFDPGNADELAMRIHDFYTFSELKKQTIRNECRKNALMNFSGEKVINAYIYEFKSALARE